MLWFGMGDFVDLLCQTLFRDGSIADFGWRGFYCHILYNYPIGESIIDSKNAIKNETEKRMELVNK